MPPPIAAGAARLLSRLARSVRGGSFSRGASIASIPGVRVSVNSYGGNKVPSASRRGAQIPKISARELQRVATARILPRLRARVPRKTGKLRSSLAFHQRGAQVTLEGVYYAPHVSWRSGTGRTTVARETHKLAADRRIHQEVARRVNRKIGLRPG